MKDSAKTEETLMYSRHLEEKKKKCPRGVQIKKISHELVSGFSLEVMMTSSDLPTRHPRESILIRSP